ncbi:hypothetical protein HY409_01980 [Candidatus Gottesmanbacteria bacterium]|nr:hypothetical protein [Candidatus Gottesmanbacteria bacterium]
MKPLAPPISLLRQALGVYLSKKYQAWFFFLGLLPTIVSFLLSFSIAFFQGTFSEIAFVLVLLLIIGALITAIVSIWYYVFLYRFIVIAVQGESIDIGQLAGQAWKRIAKLITTNIMMMLFILLGLILLIIPGLVFIVWYYFAPIIAIIEDPKIDALKESKNLVRGTFWPVTGRIVIFSCVAIVPSVLLQQLSPYLSLMWQIFAPYFTLLTFLFYLDLKSSKIPS